MNIVKDLELFLDSYLSKNIITYKRKNSSVIFIAYREGIVDKNTEAFYLTSIKYDDLQLFIQRNISIYDILSKTPVIFYAVSSIGNKECIYLNKVKFIDIDVTDDMKSLEALEICDKLKENIQLKIDQEYFKKEVYNNKINDYNDNNLYITDDVDIEDNDMLLSDDIIYKLNDNTDTDDDFNNNYYENDNDVENEDIDENEEDDYYDSESDDIKL
jgi:hypothetical protein